MKINFDFSQIARPIVASFASLFHFRKANEKEEPKERVSVGLDIGSVTMAVSQLADRNGKLVLDKAGVVGLKPGESVSSQIKSLFAQLQITEKRVNVSLKGHGIILRFISFPRMTRSEFESAIQYEAEKYIPFSISEVAIDFHFLESQTAQAASSKTMDVLLVAVRKQEVMKLVKLLQEAELQPAVIDVDAIAVTNDLLHSVDQIADKIVVAIDIGAKDTNINIIDKGILRFSRDIAFGCQDIRNYLMKKMEISEAAANEIVLNQSNSKSEHEDALRQSVTSLIQEIKVSMTYYQNQHQDLPLPSAIYMCGGGAQIPALRQALQQEANLNIVLWNPTEKLEIGSEVNRQDVSKHYPFLSVSVGLALRGCVSA